MANIAEHLTNIQSAVYGEDVRTAIKNAIQAINDEETAALVSGNGILTDCQSAASQASASSANAYQSRVVCEDSLQAMEELFSNSGPAEIALGSTKNHRNIYRGLNLGSVITDAQKESIRNGTFDNIWVGDYWQINDIVWRVVDIDYWYATGPSPLPIHHVVIMPDNIPQIQYAPSVNMPINNEATTSGGYYSSAIRSNTGGLKYVKETYIDPVFEELLLWHDEVLINAVSSGRPSGYIFAGTYVELPNAQMIFGNNPYGPVSSGTTIPVNREISATQLAIFSLHPTMINNMRISYWLRNVVSSTSYLYVDESRCLCDDIANSNHRIRPVFGITGGSE